MGVINEDAKNILLAIEKYLKKYPEERFTQALFNMGINEFADETKLKRRGFLLRDIYYDADIEVLKRISKYL